jgi:predicted nucleic acid-binding protein
VTAYVLDASVAAKWFLPEARETLAPESLAILKDYAAGRTRLLVPDLFWPEVGNILWKAVRLGRMARSSAEEAILSLTEQRIPTSPSMPLLSDAFAIASAFDRTVYDCLYVALAVASNRLLVTADERLATALAAYYPVRWLGSL